MKKVPSQKTEYSELTEALAAIARLEEELAQKTLEADALREIGQAIGLMLDIDEMLKMVADIIVQVTGTDLCLIYLLNESKTELILRATSRPAGGIIGKIRLKVGEGITGWVAKERQHVALHKEAWRDERFKAIPDLQQDTYQSMLSVPLSGKDDLVGVINVRTDPPHNYTDTQIRLLSSIATQVGRAVESYQRLAQMEKRASQLTTLSEISKTITSEMYLDEVLQLIVAMTAESMNFRICSVMLLDSEKEELVIKATQSKSRVYIKKPNLKLGESVAGRAVTEGKPITVKDVRRAPGYRFPDIARAEGLCSLICVPLKIQKRIIGVLNCYTAKPHDFTDEEVSLVTALANHAALAIENAALKVKSAVVQEMHHRVKNSLQMIASLLRLQVRYGRVDSVEQVLNESINRILSIAAVHEMLSSESLDDVSIKKIAERILAATGQGLLPPSKTVEMNVEGPDVMLPSGKATSVALILNELIHNAVEHGFKNLDKGRINILLSENDENIEIVVLNDGEALPEEFDFRTHRNLGLQIVGNLVYEDLSGNFSISNHAGMIMAQVTFPR